MNRTVIILSLTTAVLAASTIYLATDKYFRDAEAPSPAVVAAAQSDAPQRQATPAPAAQSTDEPHTGAAAADSVSTPPADTAAPAVAKQNTPSQGTLSFARQFLARYDDSAQRDAMLEETRTGLRRQYGKLQEQLGLSDATFEQLVTLLAEEALQNQEQYLRCAGDPRCNFNDPSRRNKHIDRSQEVLALLGASGADAFNQFRGSIGERDQVIQLRGRLPDSNFLPEAQAERLISALAEERKLYQQESTQRGASTNGWGTALGMLFYSNDSSSVDQQVAEATQYSQRMRARAAAVLSPAQLAAFVQMQEELLAQFAASLRM